MSEVWWNDFIHIPFKEKGRDESGADCWGLARIIYEKKKGIILPSGVEQYEHTLDRKIIQVIAEGKKASWVEVEKPEMFDLILLKQGGFPMHVGVVTKSNHMIHCQQGYNTVHERFNGLRWKTQVMGFFRYEQ